MLHFLCFAANLITTTLMGLQFQLLMAACLNCWNCKCITILSCVFFRFQKVKVDQGAGLELWGKIFYSFFWANDRSSFFFFPPKMQNWNKEDVGNCLKFLFWIDLGFLSLKEKPIPCRRKFDIPCPLRNRYWSLI